jgi:hypothetical protein
LSLSLRNPCRLILAWLCCMEASARESRVSVAIYLFDVVGRPGLLQSSLTSSPLRWLSFPRPTKERPYDLLGLWACREVFYLFSGPRGYLSPTHTTNIRSVWGEWSLKHRAPWVHAIDEIVSLVVLMSIYREVYIWYFFLKHVSEQWWLFEHVDVVVRPRYQKNNVKSTQVLRGKRFEHGDRLSNVSSCKLSYPFNGTIFSTFNICNLSLLSYQEIYSHYP